MLTRKAGFAALISAFLYRHFVEISRQQFNSAAEVSRIMSYLGDQTKFNIFSEIAKKPAYGRELAKRVGLAPCTVSQYLTSLNGTGLLDSHAVGKNNLFREQAARGFVYCGAAKKYFTAKRSDGILQRESVQRPFKISEKLRVKVRFAKNGLFGCFL